MVKLLSFLHKDNSALDFQKSVALNEQAAEANAQGADPMEAIRLAEREKMMLGDETVSKWLLEHPAFHAFIPAFAPVNRTTKHISRLDAKIAWLDFQLLFIMEEMFMNPDSYESGALEILQGFEILAATQISDGYEGWKGRILTEQKKTIKTEFSKK